MIPLNYNQYARETILKLVRQFSAYAPGVRANREIEPLHQMRVDARRLRNAFWVFKGLFPPKILKESKSKIRSLGRLLGQARDLDVKIGFLKKLPAVAKKPSLKSGIKKIIILLQKERARLQPRVIKTLADLHKKGTFKKTEQMLTTAGQGRLGSQKLYKTAEKKIFKRLKKLLTYESYVRKPKHIDELHQMRIAAKHLRYTLESFEPLFGLKMGVFIRRVMTIQGYLGEVHDFDAWKSSLDHLGSPGKSEQDLKEAVEFFSRRCESLKGQGYRKFVRAWTKARQQKTFEQLIQFIQHKND